MDPLSIVASTLAVVELAVTTSQRVLELLSDLKQRRHHTHDPCRRRVYINNPTALDSMVLESTRDSMRHQREKFLLLLGPPDAELNRRVDVAKVDDKHEDPTFTAFLPEGANWGNFFESRPESFLPPGANVGDFLEFRSEIPGWTSKAVARWTIPPHSGRGRDSNGARMEAGGKIKGDCQILVSRCVEGGLVVVGAAGAAMMSCWAQTRNTDVWTLGSAAGASALDPESVQAASVHGYGVTDIVLLQTLIPKAVFDSPAALVASIAVTTLAMTTYHYLHRHEKYQDPLIFGIAGGGALVGRLTGLDGTGVLLRIIPCCVLVSLLLSAAWSPRLAGKRHPHVDDGHMSLKAGALDAMY